MTTRLTYRYDLQGLRAIAVAMVFAYHLDLPGVGSGFVGVDVFFVLSGYLITRLLLVEAAQSARIGLLSFYARRLKRLLPSLLVMVALSAAAAQLLLPVSAWVEQTASAPFALSWTSNLFFSARELGYFDELAARDLYLHTWSLGVEEQFYLVWPLLLSALLLASRDGASGERPQRLLGVALGGLLIGGLMLSAWLVSDYPQHGFYQMPSRIWQFALGGLVHLLLEASRSTQQWPADRSPARQGTNAADALLVERGMPGRARQVARGQRGQTALQLSGLALIVVSGSGWLAGTPYPGWAALPPSLGAALVILGGHGQRSQLAPLLTHSVMRWLGDRSYSLYLWHWPVLILWESQSAAGDGPWHHLGIIALSLILADLSYRFIERPFWKGRMSRVREQLALLVGVFLILSFGSGFMTFHADQRARAETDGLHLALKLDVPPIYSMQCDTWYHSDTLQPCVFGNAKAPRTVVMIGDSIGAQWFSALPAAFDPAHWRIVVHTKSACPMVDEPYYYARIGTRYTVCERWRAALLDELQRLRPDVVVMGSSSTYENFDAQAWIDGTRRFLAPLSATAGQILVIPGTPLLGFDGPSCILRHLTPEGRMPTDACTAEGRLAQPSTVAGYLVESVATVSNAMVVNLNDLVCPEARCTALASDGIAVYRDGRHLSDSFVRTRAPSIAKRIQGQLAP